MPLRLTVALLACLLLIGGATWSRLGKSVMFEANLVAVEQKDRANYNSLMLASLEESTTTAFVSKEPLTGTDLIGRQLMLDYVDMARNGQASAGNLNTLAEKYIESIPTLISAEKLSYIDLKVVSNNKANFQKYGAEIERIYTAYATKLMGSYSEEDIAHGLEVIDLSIGVGDIYAEAASKLRNLTVPAELAEAHLTLTNVYLENATAMRALGGASGDPASSFAGLIAIKANLGKEQESIATINEILAENDI